MQNDNAGSDDVDRNDAAEIVYSNLLFQFRKQVTEYGPGSEQAQNLSKAISVIEWLFPEAVRNFNLKFGTTE